MEDGGITLGLTEALFRPLIQSSAVGLSLITVVLSNLVSNVPALLLLEPAVPHPLDLALHLEVVDLPRAQQVPS